MRSDGAKLPELGAPTLIEVLRVRARADADGTALTFLGDGGSIARTSTYGDLYRRTSALALGLRRRGLEGQRVLLALPAGYEFAHAFLACLMAGVVAVPLPESPRRRGRFRGVALDCSAAALWHEGAESAGLTKLSTEALLEEVGARGGPRDGELEIGPEEVAFLQYTSGSTGRPKGAVITHGALTANLEMIRRSFSLEGADVVGSWLPPFHDMGLVGGLLTPLWCGIPAVLMPPLSFLAKPLRWLEMIDRFRVTVSGGPDFSYRLCVARTSADERARLDLGRWQLAFSGAEPVRSSTLEAFTEAFAASGFRRRAFLPCYGLAEATLLVSAAQRGAPPEVCAGAAEGSPPIVSCGSPAPAVEVRIVHPETRQRLEEGEEGEIWVASPALAAGYWNLPPRTEDPFVEPAAPGRGEGGRRWLRTGDLGLLRGGHLHITGRLKDLIILRGRNLHPEDLEATALGAHASLAEAQAVAFGVPAGGGEIEGERPVLVLAPARTRRREAERRGEEVRRSVRRRVLERLEAEVGEVLLVRPGSLPMTSSGKIRRQKTRELYRKGRLRMLGARRRIAPEGEPHRDPLAWITAFLAARTGEDPSAIQVQRTLADHGLDSMGMTLVQHGLEREFGARIPLEALLGDPSLVSLAELVGGQAGGTGPGPSAALEEDPESRRPSEGQEAIYFLHQTRPESTAYHLATALCIEAPVGEDDLRAALEDMVGRHEALRVGFRTVPSRLGPKLESLPSGQGASLAIEDARGWSEEELRRGIAEAVRRPFDLEEGPLLRAHLWRRSGADVLALVLHHIAGDLWSVALLWQELSHRLQHPSQGRWGEPPPSFYSWVRSRRDWLESAEARASATFWRRRLEPLPPPAVLPADRPRHSGPSSAGGAFGIRYGGGLLARCRSVSRKRGTTPYMVLMAAAQILLARMTGLRRFALGALAAGREGAETAGLVGYLVNPLVAVANLTGASTFDSVLGRVREETLGMLAHGRMPFRRLVTELEPPRGDGLNPFFSTLVSWQGTGAVAQRRGKPLPGGLVLGAGGSEAIFAGAAARSLELPPRDAAFELSLLAAEEGEDLLLRLEYRADLYDSTTIARAALTLGSLLEQGLAEPSRNVGSLSLLTPAQAQQVLREANDKARSWRSGSLVEEILAQARRRPDAIALRQGSRELSFRQLSLGARRVAAALEARGLGRESVVALALERSPEWVLGALGTLLVGGAFLPLDPDEPVRRLELMVADGAPDLVLFRGSPPLDLEGFESLDLGGELPPPTASGGTGEAPGQLAYILFTSGSTGRPKGAMNTREGLWNRLLWMQEAYLLGSDDRILQKTPLTFDVSVWEVFWPLMVGARLVLAPPAAHRDPRRLVEEIVAEGITVVHFVPSLLGAFLAELPPEGPSPADSLRLIVASGEALPGPLARRLRRHFGPGLRFENLYGPTEAAIDVTAYRVAEDPAPVPVPLGSPVANTSIHVLDRRLEPLPLGTPGELFIGGVQLARGYRGDPRRTAERFLPAPAGAAGERLYRTGDLGIRRPDASLVFLRRLDGQVKVRGIRIELGEVEAVLAAHPQVAEAAAVLVEGPPAEAGNPLRSRRLRRFSPAGGASRGEGESPPPRLLAYFVPRRGRAVDLRELRSFLRHRLPPAMEPQTLVPLPRMPRTSSGKVARSELLRASPIPASGGEPFVAPKTERERALARVLESVLEVSAVGAEDDFFALGGDSILSLKVRGDLEGEGWELGLEAFLEERTVARMAQRMVRRRRRSNREEGADGRAPFRLLGPEDAALLPAGLEDAYPLSRTQSGVIFHSQFDAASPVYRDLFLARFLGPLVPSLLEKALQAAVDRHPMLRTTFDLETFSEPLQLVFQRASVELSCVDLPAPAAVGGKPRRAVEGWIEGELATPLDWTRAPVPRFFALRSSAEGFWLVISFFDALLDGWSAASLCREVVGAYDALLTGQPPVARSSPAAGYDSFVAAELEAVDDLEERAFWEERLRDAPSGELLGRCSGDADGLVEVLDVELPEPLVARLEALAQGASTGLKEVLLAAHLAALSAFAGRRSLTTGLEVHGRLGTPGGEGVLGMFMNILPFPITLRGGTWRELLEEVRDREREWLRHRRFPFAEMARGQGNPLVETVFNSTHFHVLRSRASLSRLELEEAFGFNQTSFALRADFNRNPLSGRCHLSLTVRGGGLGRGPHRLLAATYRRCLEEWAARPEGNYLEFSALGAAGEHQVLREWGRGPAAGEARGSLPRRFFRQASRSPQRVALEVVGGTSVTYGELRRRVGALAAALDREGCSAGDTIAIFAGPSPAYVTAALAVLAVRAAFLPLGIREPEHRLRELLRRGGARRVLVEPGRSLPSSLEELGMPLEAGSGSASLSPPEGDPEDLAYLIFTSGSTGAPKAVAVSHGSLAHLLGALAQTLEVRSGERWLALTEPTFDISLVELLLPLLGGGTVVVAPEEASREPAALTRAITDARLRTVQTTPGVWQALVDVGFQSPAGTRLLSGGEALPKALARELLAGGGEVWNLYGPTEATVWATAGRLQGAGAVDLGGPLPGLRAYVLDPCLRPLRVGGEGELFIAGGTLAAGYWRDAPSTAASFLPDPFCRSPGRRMYRTGDRARWNPAGRLEFLGRLDGQLKIRGARVEPGEIEAALEENGAVRRALVVAGEVAPRHRGLLAYVELEPGRTDSAQELRRFLQGRLPSFLIPSRIFVVVSWPLTRHGKVDLQRLPKPRPSRPPEDVLASLVDRLDSMTEEEARSLVESGPEAQN